MQPKTICTLLQPLAKRRWAYNCCPPRTTSVSGSSRCLLFWGRRRCTACGRVDADAAGTSGCRPAQAGRMVRREGIIGERCVSVPWVSLVSTSMFLILAVCLLVYVVIVVVRFCSCRRCYRRRPCMTLAHRLMIEDVAVVSLKHTRSQTFHVHSPMSQHSSHVGNFLRGTCVCALECRFERYSDADEKDSILDDGIQQFYTELGVDTQARIAKIGGHVLPAMDDTAHAH